MAEQNWKQAKRAILDAAKQKAEENLVDMMAKAVILNPGVKPKQKIEPLVKVLHKIGGCKLIQFQLVVSGPKYFLATYQGKRAEAGERRAAVKMLRRFFPRVKRPVREKGEIVALRVWKLSGEFLSPVTRGADYGHEGPVMIADQLPTMSNSHGFWSIKPGDDKLLHHLVNSYDADVYGIVGLFGRVVEHVIGYRAEKMIIRKLMLAIPSTQGYRDVLARRYDCEVVQGDLKLREQRMW